jgi:hypothetical protein
MDIDWGKVKGAIGTIAPWIAGTLGTPVAGVAVQAICGVLGLSPDKATPDDVMAAIKGATPEQLLALKQADLAHQETMQKLGYDHIEKLEAEATAREKIAADDRASARSTNAAREAVWWIAAGVLATFTLIMGAVLWGCWTLLNGGITIHDVSVVAAISGLVGSIVGYVAANAQTVINFIYGGSMGSEKKTDALQQSVSQAIKAAAGQ